MGNGFEELEYQRYLTWREAKLIVRHRRAMRRDLWLRVHSRQIVCGMWALVFVAVTIAVFAAWWRG